MKNNYGKILKYTYYISVLVVFSVVGLIYAVNKKIIFADETNSIDEFGSHSIDEFFGNFYPWVITMSIGLAVIMLIYSGYLYVTSAGNTEQINNAKGYIVGALSGLAFLILASLIYRTLSV